jgi:hypothetical protein
VKLPQSDIDELAARLKQWLAYDAARSPAPQRKALRDIEKRLGAAAEIIAAMTAGGVDITNETPLKSAWRLIHANMTGKRSSLSPLHAGTAVVMALRTWSTGAERAARQVPKTRLRQSALPLITDAVLAYVKHRGGKVSAYERGDAVEALLSTYRTAGVNLTRAAAHKSVKGQIRLLKPRK